MMTPGCTPAAEDETLPSDGSPSNLRTATGVGGRAGEAAEATGRRIAGAGLIQVVFRGVGVLLSAATIFVLARALGPEAFGAWTVAFAFVGLFGFVTDLGLVNIAIQRMAGNPDQEGDWLGALVALRSFAALGAIALCLLAIPVISAEGETRTLVAILAPTILLAAPAAFMAVFQARLRAGIQMAVLTLQGLVWFATVIVLAAFHSDVTIFAVALVGVSLGFAAVNVLTVLRYARVSLRRGRRLWRALFSVSAPMAIGGLLVTGYYRLDAIFVLNIAGAAEAGQYGAAYRLLDTLHFLPAAVMVAVFPAVSAIHGSDPARVHRLVEAAGRYIAVIALGVFAGTLALADPFVATFLGNEYGRSAEVLPVLMLAFVFISQGYVAGWLVPVVGLQWFYAGCAAAGLALNVTLNLILVPHYGALGAAWATVATELVVNALTLTAVYRSLGFRPRASRLLRVIGAALVLGISARAAGELGLAPGLLVGPPVYLFALVALGVVDRDDLAVLTRRSHPGATTPA
jgi:O-antigen/teichoic acid export membrane protein